MAGVFFRPGARFAAYVIPLFLLVGCAIPILPQPEAPNNIEPVLTAIENPVQVARADGAPTVLEKNETFSLKVNDIMTADEPGRGIFLYDNRVAVDLFRGSAFRLTGITPQAGDTIVMELEQIKGHIRVATSKNARARVRLVTSIATITTLRDGTDFLICHNPVALSCIVALSGEVEVVGQGKAVIIKGGEATFVLKDQPPSDAICAQPGDVDAWINQKIGTAGEVQPISKLVSGWKAESCAAATQAAAAPPAPGLPSPENMVKIEAGAYTVGAQSPNQNQAPAQVVNLEAYWIDQFEVTNAQYEVFLNETSHDPPLNWPGEANQPVAGITYEHAESYCTWAKKRLPSEAEWEAAARGPGENPPLYPWGSDNQAGGSVYDLPLNETYQAGAYSFNQSVSGVFDQAGNVWEWVGEPYAPVADYNKVLRGGRYGLLKDMAHREQVTPDNARYIPYAGFRCAANQVEGN